jgi:mono/diheme cytochrome c family protein
MLLAVLITATTTPAAEIPQGAAGYASQVTPFFKAHCLRCHGPTKHKGQITLHDLDGNFSAERELERWELVLEMLQSGEMPPEDERQPSGAERQAIVNWIEAGLRDSAGKTSHVAKTATARRLTNVEYQNTMRDLLGFELKLIDNLPEDPVKPYQFNNTAEFMLLGPEQMDRYKENAQRAMASAIVDPGEPQTHRTTRVWKPLDPPERGMQYDEIGIYGNRRNTAAWGMGLKSWPQTGEYRIRVKAAAILPPGIKEVPLRLVMGYNLGENSSMLQIEPVGTLRLTNNVDNPQVFEFRGRIENHPARPGRVTSRGLSPQTMTITPQNLYDNGRLNDRLDPLAMPRAVVQSIEFEAPVLDVWPPEHHTRILFDSPLRESDPDGYVREVLERFMSRAFRRPATADELDRFKKIYSIFAADVGAMEAAMRDTLAMVLISPQFLYHTVAEERTASPQYELASKLSYFLWASMPDDELMALAAAGKLDDPAVIRTQVDRLLADERSRDFVDNFTTQWLSIAKMKAVKINTSLFPRFLYLVAAGERRGTEVPYRPTIRDHMHEETVGFITELIQRNASVLNIIDSEFACLNQPLAAHYGVEGVQGHQLRPVPIKPEHRLGGLLTQGSVLVGNSTGSAPHPIYRAVWLREAILGDEVKPPPAEVPALVDSVGDAAENAVTIKDLLRQHRQVESCHDCHARLDPWGIPFERYSAIGRFQPRVPAAGARVRGFNQQIDQDLAGYTTYLASINTVKVEADARVPHGHDIDGMRELKDYLLAHHRDDIVNNVLRRLLTYALGRELSWRDRFAVQELVQQSQNNEYKLRDMIVAICQSPTFRGVRPQEN